MPHKRLLFHSPAREKLLEGAQLLAEAVGVTLGPKSSKRARPLLSAILVAALGCSTLRTTVDYDPATDFSRFHTFTFRAPPADRTPRSQERIEAFIADALEARGLARASEESADLRVYTKVILDHRHENDNFAYGYGSRPGGGLVVTPGRDVSLGTLLVDLVDVQRQELVWRGRAADVLEPDREARDRQLRTAITRMFARYPSPPGR